MLSPMFQLNALALLRVITKSMEENSPIIIHCIGYIGVNCHMGATELGVASY